MSYGQPRSGIPTAAVAVLATCGGCLLIAVVAIVVLVNAGINSTPALEARATLMQSQKRYGEAEQLFLQALKKSPNNAAVLNNLAWAYYLDKKYAVGEPYARRAVQLDGNPNSVDTLAHLHLGLRQLDKAEKEFKSALAANPNLGASLDGLGQICEQRGQYAKAIEMYNKAIDAEPTLEGTQERIDNLESHGHGAKKKPAGKKAARPDNQDD
jgi:Tfp pilus assembly protein PilF